ncbi:hypothetical protein K461DRAFT_275810 [Myriangium duriaei CBS 260.36]|uniref:ER membrane protein complex subunit 6 n=1 Tax=Myriangium duriaei CBS 260.36 TaxID=1168546 RepID=A0A9P4MLY2_9PEZI|nr:hypothetical protein K461DRAFT_275810 [Myriangium duriaei CBS 260.36]
MVDEKELQIHPIVQESLQHNARVTSNIRALTASLFGVAAGTLGLESYPGFLFFIIGTIVVQVLVLLLRAEGKQEKFFHSPISEFWIGDAFSGFMSFVLTWTLFYGLVKA